MELLCRKTGKVSNIPVLHMLERISEKDMESRVQSDSIGSVDPDPYSESGSKRAKITHKSRKKLRNFIF
jgi:hypothetical protein